MADTEKTASQDDEKSLDSSLEIDEQSIAEHEPKTEDEAKDDETSDAVDPESEPEKEVPTEVKWQAAATAAQEAHKEKLHRIKGFFRGYWRKKKWTLPLTIVLLIALILGVPFTRYKVLGLFMKQTFQVSVLDSGTDKPISGAAVSIASKTANTDAAGKASLRVPVGPQKVTVSKKYYKVASANVTVPLMRSSSVFKVPLVATGRQVPITITDKITGKGLANVAIAVLGTNTKTDKDGKAIIVLPTTAPTQKANLTLAGYNANAVTVQVTDQAVAANTFALTPAGNLYFLSNLSGKIDVVKTNLDGTGRATVLAGTGSEDSQTTSLLASRDWKYLALLAKRENGQQGIYLINTDTDKVTNIDGGSDTATFNLVGWSNDIFVYEVLRSNINNWQSGAQVLKSYDAVAGKLYNIDQSQGEGSSSNDYGYTSFGNVYILGTELVYVKNWFSSYLSNHLNGKNVSLVSVQADSSGKKTIQDFPIPAGSNYYFVRTASYDPSGVYLAVPDSTGKNSYYKYENGKVAQDSTITDDTFNKPYPTYLASPSGRQTFWSEVRDNKNTLFIGDADGQGAKQIASLSDYTPYGWYTDNYLLVSKGGSELYAMPVGGGAALKITDYYKPQVSYNGYGGGYGGL